MENQSCNICRFNNDKGCIYGDRDAIPGTTRCVMFEKLSKKEIKTKRTNETKNLIQKRLEAI